MQYSEIDIRLQQVNPFADILVARLNEVKFESFLEDKNGVKAYIPTCLLDTGILESVISEISKLTKISFTINTLKKENWNAKWESNYPVVVVNENCVVRSHFHNPISDIEYDLVITPKMSFGTGHHETTVLMMNEIFSLDLERRSVLDIGSGTGVLTILASKLGARDLVGIDVDEWAFKNAKENADLNHISNIHFIHGDINDIGNVRYDVLLANINRNCILNDIEKYVSIMNNSADILLSGFLEEDSVLILNKTEQLGLELVVSKNKNKWQMLHLKKV